jgi:hypothetical protein
MDADSPLYNESDESCAPLDVAATDRLACQLSGSKFKRVSTTTSRIIYRQSICRVGQFTDTFYASRVQSQRPRFVQVFDLGNTGAQAPVGHKKPLTGCSHAMSKCTHDVQPMSSNNHHKDT